MKTIKIALSLALGMSAACYVGPDDELGGGIDENRTDKLTFSSGHDAEVDKNRSSCDDDRNKDAALQLGLSAPVEPQSQGGPPPPPPGGGPPPPPDAATTQELIDACEDIEGIDLSCEEICEDAGLVYTGEVGIDPGTVMVTQSPPMDTGLLCPDGTPDMTTTTTTTAECVCCCAAPPQAG